MASKNIFNKPIGVIGAGSFGLAVANLLAENTDVILYARNQEALKSINETGEWNSYQINKKIEATDDLEHLAKSCDIIFPVVPSANFREMIKSLSPFLHPYHILIHGTKGLNLNLPEGKSLQDMKMLERHHIKTMSEVIMDESVVVRVGCLAGPNLAKEISQGMPAATVVASHFNEVIQIGQQLLRSDRFQVYGNPDLIGIELCGVLKNIIAIASGALSGLGLGENARSLLISRGMAEMIYLGKALGGNVRSFIGLAGIGDLMATSHSTLSRNFTVGKRLAEGENLNAILTDMAEVAEGVNTIMIAKRIAESFKVRAPITEILHRVLFEGLTMEEAVQYLMKYPLNVDVDFI
ncbi:NAD(P)H-dependent glycerol-3-phosphate dehydrogenase [Marivirga arenosa]|uniref:Glycerol-3-phosphate dehydrogenase [NAD(P)+] n=1 Tax=Marivirga arenosa TaxID=3059076 RepID=A0AA51ZV37_9BACT|nr:NAD(P)H-dependent glycerol-3-phosphate dehydrogenase [Marivirga sp. BKB1-2]WNB17291.1 NAD(P)H-dependent glycerol-3-phosphate dehydrogenase [Marivirga sp. BKB1-2]